MAKIALTAVLVACAIGTTALDIRPASAITAELAKKCRALALKAYPPPPTGSKSGNAAQMRGYYANCLSHDGNTAESQSPQNNAASPPANR